MSSTKTKKIIQNIIFASIFLGVIILFIYGLKQNHKQIEKVNPEPVEKLFTINYQIEVVYLDGVKDTLLIESQHPLTFDIAGSNGVYYLKDNYGDVYQYAVIRSKTISTTSNTNN